MIQELYIINYKVNPEKTIQKVDINLRQNVDRRAILYYN